MSALRIYVVDDHPIVRNGLRSLIESQKDMEVVGEAFDGATAVHQVLECRPDIVVMDVSMPGMGGVEATTRIHAERPEIQVIALTAHEDRAYLQQMRRAGASGYVLKRTAADDLIEAIRHAAVGNFYVDPATAEDPGADSGRPEIRKTTELSERELEVLQPLAQGYSNKQIAARLKVSVKTVETYKARAMEKLGLKSRVDIVKYAGECGWLNRE